MSGDWYPWYPALYAADTLHLTPEQDGLYRRLIDWYMENRRPLPDNDQALAAICRVGVDQWMKSASLIRPFFTPKGLLLHQRRCNRVLDAQDSRAKIRGEIAKKGAEARWNKANDLDASGMRPAFGQHASTMLGKDATVEDTTVQDKAQDRTEPYDQRLVRKQFETIFWPAYPKKEGRKLALAAFIKVRKKYPIEAVMKGLAIHLANYPDRKYVKQPAAFLNQERFLDEPVRFNGNGNGNGYSNGHASAEPPPRQTRNEYLETLLGLYAKTHEWNDVWGERSELPPEFAARLAAIDEASAQASLPGLS